MCERGGIKLAGSFDRRFCIRAVSFRRAPTTALDGVFPALRGIFVGRMRRACATDRRLKESALSMEDHVSSPPAPFTRVDEEAANEH